MENASKALLIAGAILIVILLIAVGMMVYNSAAGTIDKAIGSMSTTEKQIHNSQFDKYIGNNIKGQNVKTLISNVSANNGNDDNVKVELTGITSLNDISTSANTTYTVTLVGTDDDGMTQGLITGINIAKN